MPWDDGINNDTPAYPIAADNSPRIRVIAGPGTGKSFSMRRRVARLIESGVSPERILAVTFTRIAAEDIRRELNGLNVEGAEQIQARTLHSLALRVLFQQHVIQSLGRMTRPILGFEMEPLLYDLGAQFGTKTQRSKRIKAYEAAFARNQNENPLEAADPIDNLFRNQLVDWMIFHKCMLLGEVIPFLYVYLNNNPASPEFNDFDHILVDEYQDLNRVEQSCIALLGRNSRIVIVGDENQSIYSFKHAHPEGIIEWEIENEHRTDHELTVCYRSPERVVSIANNLIAHNPDGNAHPLQIRPENGEGTVRIVQFAGIDEEAAGIATDIVQRIRDGTPPGDIIVLSPRKKLGLKISALLREANIPCRDYLSESELEAKEVIERLALLMLACNRDDRPALRWLLGFGSTDFRAGQYARLLGACAEHSLSPWDALVLNESGGLALQYCASLKARFNTIRQSVEDILNQGNAIATLDYLFPPNEDNSARIRELFTDEMGAETSLEQVRKILLEKIYEPNFPSHVEYVRIMTLYGSKGLGSPIVYITSLVDGLLPRFIDEDDDDETRERKLREQRRLFYVALTRVKSVPDMGKPGELTLSSFRVFGWKEAHNLNNGNANALASRFLSELGPRAPAAIKL